MAHHKRWRVAICLWVVVSVFLVLATNAHQPDHATDVAHVLENGQSQPSPVQRSNRDVCNYGKCCPVCFKEVGENDPHAVFREGQELYACNHDHLSRLLNDPIEYVRTHERSHTEAEVEGKRCPVCGMQADAAHALDFLGNQSIFFCNMGSDQRKKFLADTEAFVLKIASGNGTMPVEERYCSGRTVMYMTDGFTYSDSTCLVLFLSSWILDDRVKTILACLGCFALAIVHEALVAFRRSLVYRQRMKRSQVQYSGYDAVTTEPTGNATNTLTDRTTESTLLLTQSRPRRKSSNTFTFRRITDIVRSPTLGLDISVALLHGLGIGLGYLVMLAVMTYHPGFFLAVSVGFSFGQLLFKDADAPLADGEPIDVSVEPCCS